MNNSWKTTVLRMKNFLKAFQKNDPVKNCEVHRDTGCAHVDGFLCDMKTCDIRKNRQVAQDKNK